MPPCPAWVITQTTRFKAAMVGAGLTNMWSMYGTNDIPSTLIAYFGGIPNEKTLPLYLSRSAMTHVDKVTTPTLILHGANDERVPVAKPRLEGWEADPLGEQPPLLPEVAHRVLGEGLERLGHSAALLAERVG